MKKTLILFPIFYLTLLFVPLIGNAAIFNFSENPVCQRLEIPLPFFPEEVCGPAEYLIAAYRLALYVGVFVYAHIIVMAGVQYATAGDSVNVTKEAIKQITQAITGLIILFASVLILRLIHPQLPDLGKWEGLEKIGSSSPKIVDPKCIAAQDAFFKCRSEECDTASSSAPSYSECLRRCAESTNYIAICSKPPSQEGSEETNSQ